MHGARLISLAAMRVPDDAGEITRQAHCFGRADRLISIFIVRHQLADDDRFFKQSRRQHSLP